jgi:L-cysteine desulfidase
MPEIFIDAMVTTDKGAGRATIKGKHTNIVLIEADGRVLYRQEEKTENRTNEKPLTLRDVKLTDLIKFVRNVPFEDIRFTLEAVEMNGELAQSGMNGSGMSAAAAINTLIEKRQLSEDIITAAQLYTGYAVDARMGGKARPAMSICGSGNHGIIATMPLLAISEKRNIGKEQLARAIALSYLITIYIKEHAGRLSAFCGCAVAAGTGASAAIVYLLEGTNDQIAYAINNMGGNITGMICDGGNFGCSLKAITAAGTATMCALFALNNVVIPHCNGIVGRNVEETMKNMGTVASPGMVDTDNTIVDIMQSQNT